MGHYPSWEADSRLRGQEIPYFHETRRIITVFTEVRH
jgi:hypothetical protein